MLANITANNFRGFTMGMISSENLAKDLGVSHKQVKKLILDYNIRAIPSGSSDMDPGKIQRMVLVDEEAFHGGLSLKAKDLRRPKVETTLKKNGKK